jgi:peroxiredoxin
MTSFRKSKQAVVRKSISKQLVIPLWIQLCLLFVFAPAFADSDPWKALEIERLAEAPASNFTLSALEGGYVKLSDFKGRVVLINFWATWCLPCKAEMPSMERTYAKYKDQGLTILAVNMREEGEKVKEFVKDKKFSFPILLDTKGRVSYQYQVKSIPVTYIVNKEGKAVGKVSGVREWEGEHVDALVVELLGKSSI